MNATHIAVIFHIRTSSDKEEFKKERLPDESRGHHSPENELRGPKVDTKDKPPHTEALRGRGEIGLD